MSIKCVQCGAAVTDDSKFCKYCGAKIPEEAKPDVKRREFKIDINSASGVRRAEIRKEREAQRLEYAKKMKEQAAEREKQNTKQMKYLVILAIAVLLIALIMNVINK